jgi:capsular exopolysaccharide synthesis family protein
VTQTILAETPALARRVLVAAGRPPSGVKSLLDHTSVYSNADVLVFSITGSDAALTARLAGAYAREYASYRRELDTRELSRTLSQLEARIAALRGQSGPASRLYATLLSKAQDVRLLEALRQANVYVIRRPALGDVDQIAPRTLRNTAIGAAVGLMLGVVAAFLANALDTRIRSTDELEEGLGLPLLTQVPRRDSWDSVAPIAVLTEADTPEVEAFLMLRTKLALANVELQARTLMLTGADDDAETSVVAANLAAAMARAGKRVLLVDLDLRGGDVTSLFGLGDGFGITSVAIGEADLDDALTPVSVSVGDSGSVGGVLHVLATGPLPPRPGEFVASAAIASILDKLRERADLVLVVAPPPAAVSDALVLAPSVDALVLVARFGGLRRKNAHELRRILADWPGRALGFVLTGAEPPKPSKGGPGRRVRRFRSAGRPPLRSRHGGTAEADRPAESLR